MVEDAEHVNANARVCATILMGSGVLVDTPQGVLKEGSGYFSDDMEGCWLWCLYVRYIGFGLSYDTAALLFWRILCFLFLLSRGTIVNRTKYCWLKIGKYEKVFVYTILVLDYYGPP